MPKSGLTDVHHVLVDETAAVERQQGAYRALRVVASLVAHIGLAYLLVVSIVLAATKCGDGCEGAAVGPEHWQWTAQLVLAAAAAVTGAIGMALGSASRTVASRALLAVSVLSALAWLVWVLGFGTF